MYFSLQARIGSRIGPVWREFLAWERLPPEQLDLAIEQKLARLLERAVRNSEYYRRPELHRRPSENAADWLHRFRPLTRVQVREHFSQILSDHLRAEIASPDAVARKRYDWLVVKTGGSTGVPTTVVHDACGRDWGRATRLYAARQCGFPLGTPYFRLWGSEQDLLKQDSSLQQRVLRAVLGEVPMNAFKAKEDNLRQYLQTMLDQPAIQYLMTYVDAAAGLAQFAQERHLACPKLKAIMACAGTVTPEYRHILRQTFQAEIFDKYGSRECCDMACECRHHAGLHVFAPNVYLEIVDEKDQECHPGKPGRILVTLLNNPGFPLIRYEVGDLGAWAANAPCPCGSPFRRIQELQGRQDDMLTTADGTLQSSVFVRHFVGVSLNRQIIREWQLEQIDKTRFVFRYRPQRQQGLGDNLSRLEESFKLVFGGSATIQMLEVDQIPPSPSGKVQWVINRCRK